jgi:FdhD protein
LTTTPVRSQVKHAVRRLREGDWSRQDDVLAAEEPLEIRLLWQEDGVIQRKPIAVTMRTPGDDFELAAGFLYGEGLIQRQADVVDVSYCTDEDEDQQLNIVNVTLRPGLVFDTTRLERNFYTTSSCGVCGKAALDALEVQGCAVVPAGPVVSAELICGLPEKLRAAQAVFDRTGGLHATGLFTPEGELMSLREDVGRHNAFDKLVGEQFLAGRTPLDGHIAMLSGRASFELLQKALVARIPIVAAVGAPSSLAVQLADEFNITLCGFVRPDSLNVYTGQERIKE